MHTLLNFKGRLLVLLLALVCGASVSAQDFPVLHLDDEFTLKYMDSAIWSFTAEEDGIIKIVGANEDEYFGPCLSVYDEIPTEESVGIEMWYFNPAHYEFIVAAEKTYYILNNNWSGQDINARIEEGGSFAFDHSEPENGGYLTITGNDDIHLYFTSSTVSFSDGELTVNDNVFKIYNFNDYNDLVDKGIFTYTQEGSSGVVDWNGNICARSDNEDGIAISLVTTTGHDFYNVLNRLIEEKKLNSGDEIKLTMHGVKSELTGELANETGDIELSWLFGSAPTVLLEAKVPETLLSWYNYGDQSAVAKFTFSNNINSARATLEMGQGEGADDLYVEEILPSHIRIEENVVSVDFSGMLRTYETMGLKNKWTTFNFKLYNVIDVEGNYTYSDDLGSAASYSYTMGYKNVSATVSSEFTPKSGSNLTADDKEIEIWFNHNEMIEWNAVTFVYYLEEEVEDKDAQGNTIVTKQNVRYEKIITKSNLTVTTEDDETTIKVAVPEGLWKANNIRLYVNINRTADGRPHNIVAYYNTRPVYALDLVRYADPANESTVHRLSEICLSLGMTYSICNSIDAPVKVYGRTTRYSGAGKIVENGKVAAKIILDEPIYAADTYDITIVQGAIGDYDYGESNYHSGTASLEAKLTYTVSGQCDGRDVVVAPEDGATVDSLKTFRLTFYNPVSVAPSWDYERPAYVEEVIADGENIIHNGQFTENTGVSNELQFVLMETISKGGNYRLVLAKGSVVNGATGDPLETEYIFNYNIEAVEDTVPADPPIEPDPIVPAIPTASPQAGETLTSLKEVTLTYPVAVTIASDFWSSPYVADSVGDLVIAGALSQINDSVLLFTAYESVVKEGEYTLIIPSGNVMADTIVAPEFKITYYVDGSEDITEPEDFPGGEPEITPEPGAQLDSLQYFTITFVDWGSFSCTEEYPVIKNADGEVVVTAWNGLELDWADSDMKWNVANIAFEEAVASDGEYTLVVPVTLYSTGWTIIEDKTYEFQYTVISKTSIDKVFYSETTLVDVFNLSGELLMKNADSTSLKSLVGGFYIINGKKILLR